MHAEPSLPTTQSLWTPTSDANVLGPDVKRFAGYDAVRIILGLVLLTAAALKGYQLATEPVAETSLLTSRWFLIGVVEFELFFGLWLLAGLLPRVTWAAALGCFGLFACVSLYKALSGAASCGCFGKVSVNPWQTLILDIAAVATLWRWRPTRGQSPMPASVALSRRRAAGIAAVSLIVGIPVALAMGSYQVATLDEAGDIFGDGKFVVLEPETWVGKRFPLLKYIDICDQLVQGEWIVVVVRPGCARCESVVRRFAQDPQHVVAQSGRKQLGFLILPEDFAASRSSAFSEIQSDVLQGHIRSERVWFVETPVVLHLSEGRVVGVRTGLSAGTHSERSLPALGGRKDVSG